jgi:hypothetical protein
MDQTGASECFAAPREKSALHRFRNAARKTWNHGSFLHEMSFAIARHAILVHNGGNSKAADVLLGEVKMPCICYGGGEAPFRHRPRSRSGTRCGLGLGSGVESKKAGCNSNHTKPTLSLHTPSLHSPTLGLVEIAGCTRTRTNPTFCFAPSLAFIRQLLVRVLMATSSLRAVLRAQDCGRAWRRLQE